MRPLEQLKQLQKRQRKNEPSQIPLRGADIVVEPQEQSQNIIDQPKLSLSRLVAGHINDNFPVVSSSNWKTAQKLFDEAQKLMICYHILDQLNETDGDNAMIDVRSDPEYSSEYDNTKEVCLLFKRHGFTIKEEYDYNHPVFILQRNKSI